MLATCLSQVAQVIADFAIAVHRAAFQPRLLYVPKKTAIILRAL
jgi:hypothetical protein